jgi:YHS domain-containing protein|tara:strand:- start:353 stop:862 length:510 start_codon:yes stop_codon:yes gene_type:complete
MRLSKTLIVFFSLLTVHSAQAESSSLFQHKISDPVRQKEFSLKKKLILAGYDVVSYQQEGGPKKGVSQIQTNYKGVTYYFLSEANKSEFSSDPQRYEPLYGGWCAYAMLDGSKTAVDPETFKIVDQRLLVFYNGVWGNTLERWDKMLIDKVTDTALIKQADEEWDDILR